MGVGAARQADPHPDVRFVDLRQSQGVDVPALRGSEGVLRSGAAPCGYEKEKEEDMGDEGSHGCDLIFTRQGRVARAGAGKGKCRGGPEALPELRVA